MKEKEIVFKRSKESKKKLNFTLWGSIALIIVLSFIKIYLGIIALIALGTSIAIDIRNLRLKPITYKNKKFYRDDEVYDLKDLVKVNKYTGLKYTMLIFKNERYFNILEEFDNYDKLDTILKPYSKITEVKE